MISGYIIRGHVDAMQYQESHTSNDNEDDEDDDDSIYYEGVLPFDGFTGFSYYDDDDQTSAGWWLLTTNKKPGLKNPAFFLITQNYILYT